MSPLPPWTLQSYSIFSQEFSNVIFSDRWKDYGLERGTDYPRITQKLKAKPGLKPWFVNLLFTQHSATCNCVEGGEIWRHFCEEPSAPVLFQLICIEICSNRLRLSFSENPCPSNIVSCWVGRWCVRSCRLLQVASDDKTLSPWGFAMWDYGKNVAAFFSNFHKNHLYFYFRENQLCLPMKIKYGNNENCRSTIHENPHQHIEIWCLQNRKQINL